VSLIITRLFSLGTIFAEDTDSYLVGPRVDVAELFEVVDEVKPVGGEAVIRNPHEPFLWDGARKHAAEQRHRHACLNGVATEFVVETAARYAPT